MPTTVRRRRGPGGIPDGSGGSCRAGGVGRTRLTLVPAFSVSTFLMPEFLVSTSPVLKFPVLEFLALMLAR